MDDDVLMKDTSTEDIKRTDFKTLKTTVITFFKNHPAAPITEIFVCGELTYYEHHLRDDAYRYHLSYCVQLRNIVEMAFSELPLHVNDYMAYIQKAVRVRLETGV